MSKFNFPIPQSTREGFVYLSEYFNASEQFDLYCHPLDDKPHYHVGARWGDEPHQYTSEELPRALSDDERRNLTGPIKIAVERMVQRDLFITYPGSAPPCTEERTIVLVLPITKVRDGFAVNPNQLQQAVNQMIAANKPSDMSYIFSTTLPDSYDQTWGGYLQSGALEKALIETALRATAAEMTAVNYGGITVGDNTATMLFKEFETN